MKITGDLGRSREQAQVQEKNSTWLRDRSVATRCVHSGSLPLPSKTRPKVMPIFSTSVFSFDYLDQIDEVYEGKIPGYVYSRMRNPGIEALEEAVASLENTPGAVAFSSGMAAITLSVLSEVSKGDHVVAAKVLYGGTYTFFKDELPKRGVETTFVDINDLDAVKSAMKPNTKILYCETISNPLMEVSDLERLAEIAHSTGARLFVDNTFASPILCRPFEYGADLVIHSGTKYLNGHSDVTAGIVCGGKDLVAGIRSLATMYGPVLSPFDAWLLLRGLRTLHLRMQRHSENAQKLAEFLKNHPKVTCVHYPGLESSPYHSLARKYLKKGYGGMLSFEVIGGIQGARRVIDSLKMVELVPSLAGISTTVSHPGKTSHRAVPLNEREAFGVGDGLIRVSVGVEEYGDIEEDFRQALAAI
ncbi:MAG: aminotransferase class I/II-fold pyridoxal phosphate-dependent enzyme [Candidatus Fermentithermobacillus carboniphilus]|uniref:homocysteine desulfhydrase n=1 Tax=Candidatus Fermentithermobacillus carboniphilus TaxID=3085328 RepID=A0AAT9LB07_9FIRM|nr:MAG: aminotransferase class I/II-fold pyridoxal phosphate-dependent enzyme [Candidatus Fermentithermobacillus carboniphilus]